MHALSVQGRAGRTAWERAHQQFHRLLVAGAGPVINASIETCWARSERTRRAHLRADPDYWRASDREHLEVLEAYQSGQPERAVAVLSEQLARVAVAVIAKLDANHPMPAITQAMRQATGEPVLRS
jgi:DNA-binding GntR family transcriptional regulator